VGAGVDGPLSNDLLVLVLLLLWLVVRLRLLLLLLLLLLLGQMLSAPVDKLLDRELSKVRNLCLQDQLSQQWQLVRRRVERDLVICVVRQRLLAHIGDGEGGTACLSCLCHLNESIVFNPEGVDGNTLFLQCLQDMDFEVNDFLFGLCVDLADDWHHIGLLRYKTHVFHIDGFQTVNNQIEANINELVCSHAYHKNKTPEVRNVRKHSACVLILLFRCPCCCSIIVGFRSLIPVTRERMSSLLETSVKGEIFLFFSSKV